MKNIKQPEKRNVKKAQSRKKYNEYRFQTK